MSDHLSNNFRSLMKKKSFTLIEMLIVITIISILLVVFRNMFQWGNSQILEAQSCVNNIYGEIKSFITTADTNKGIYKEGTKIFPNYYFIQIDPQGSWYINFYYTTGTLAAQTGERQLINLTTYSPCILKNYLMAWSGSATIITMNAGGQKTQEHPSSFSLSNQASQHMIAIQVCDKNKVNCKDIGKLVTDTRIQATQKYLCNTFSWDTCQEWIQ